MNRHINLRTDKLIALKTYVRIDENIKIRIKKNILTASNYNNLMIGEINMYITNLTC